MRSKAATRIGLIAAGVAGIVTLFAVAAQTEPTTIETALTAEVAPTPVGDSQGRAESAAKAVAIEQARIAKARSAFASDLSNAPTKRRDYMISLTAPVPAPRLFAALASTDVGLHKVHAWLQDAWGSEEITTGTHPASYIGWSPNDQGSAAARKLEQMYQNYARNQAALLQSSGKKGGDARGLALLERRADALAAIAAAITREGVSLYGWSCSCSPQELMQVEQAAGVTIRIVEAEADYDYPVWPQNPARDRVMAGR